MTKEKQQRILNIFLIYVILQPIFDILSFLSIRDIIPFKISTYVKPIFVFGFAIYLLLFYNKNKKKWYLYILTFILYLVGHFYILYKLYIPFSTLAHEFRYILNISYMIALFLSFSTLYKYYYDKQELLTKIKRTITITILLYCFLYLVSVLTNTSAMTYEYSDKNKLGYKGWFDSGQILGHSISIVFPILLYNMLRPKQKWYLKILFVITIITVVSLFGTKVPYYIVLLVLGLYLVIAFAIKIFNKEFKKKYFNIILVFISLLAMILTYKYTPVAYNTNINKSNLNVSLDNYDMDEIDGSANIDTLDEIIKNNQNGKLDRLIEYRKWNIASSEYLSKLFKSGKLHPTDMRKKQFYYSTKKFELSSLEYKIFGIGFLNQDETLAMESDFFMSIFAFGILGFILFLTIPLYYFFKTLIFILKNIKKCDLEIYMLFMGLGIFFCISIWAGYTYIYTNFSIFLVLLITMIKCKMDLIIKDKLNNNKVSFLLLHLGYGGIESSTINTANALCDKYDIELVSFYKLNKNQVNKINDNITIKYLYNGSPNKEEFLSCLHNKQIFGILKEGIKSITILIKKKLLVIKYIINSDSLYIISTRYDFSKLLSKYGNNYTVKIAQEHHYHNNDKKYLNILKNKYYNIDYLMALTKTLESDYKKLLKNNKHTKIVLMPNMLYDIPLQKSKIDTNNIITVSRLDPGKKNDDIIRIISKIKDKTSKLYIIGDGIEYNNLKELIKELHLEDRVILTGYKSKEEIEKYMLKSSLFLMASLTEGLPMVLLEAMSYGLPCIAYETASGVSDIIKNDYNGYVIKSRNEEEYIKKVNEVMSNKKLREKLSKNTENTIKRFSKEEILKRWYKILK